MLTIANLRISFGNAVAIRDLNLQVPTGQALGIAGESGSGKSLLLFAILGLLPRQAQMQGQILFNGAPLGTTDVGMVFQEPMSALNPLKRIEDLLMEPLRLHQALPRRIARTEATQLLRDVEMPDPETKLRAYPHELSGGQRQRVLLAMALALAPKVLLADEPTTALDAHLAQSVLALMKRLCAARGMTLLLVSHDLGVLARSTDTLCVLYGGDIVEHRPTQDCLEHPKHPYTKGLISARPQLRSTFEGRKPRFTTIKGSVPALAQMPKGCRFSGRCPQELPQCANTLPPRQSDILCHIPGGL